MSSCWIKTPLATLTDDECHGVVVRDGIITELIGANQTPSGAVDEVLDASNLVLLPGLINTHHHFYQTLTRCIRTALDKPLFPWLTALYPLWANLTPDMVELSTELALTELLLSGCTTSTDHHYVFNPALGDAIDRQVAVARRVGLRVVLTRGSMSLSQKDGGLPPDSVVQDEATILADCERLIAEYHDPAPQALCQIALAPCSPFSVTASLMRDTVALAEREDVLIHTHLAETLDEEAFCLAQFGQRPVDYMESLGWLTARTWFAHGIHFNTSEQARLGAAGCGVSHCASSNMVLASGVCPVMALERQGVSVSLGVDGSASNDHSNLMQEVRQAFLLQRLNSSDQIVSHLDALRWATQGGANLLQRPELGCIRVGAAADLALFDLEALRFSGAQDPLAALVIAGADRAHHVMVAGQWRVKHGDLVDGDIERLRRQHQSAAEALWAAL